MNFPTDLIANIISKAMQAVDMIKRNPVGFLKNLLRAIKQGFIQFFAHIATHLMTRLTGWLMAELRDANVPAPENFTLQAVIRWILRVLVSAWKPYGAKLAAHPRNGPQRVARIRGLINTLEGIWTFIRDVQERGVAAIWGTHSNPAHPTLGYRAQCYQDLDHGAHHQCSNYKVTQPA